MKPCSRSKGIGSSYFGEMTTEHWDGMAVSCLKCAVTYPATGIFSWAMRPDGAVLDTDSAGQLGVPGTCLR